MSAQNPQYQVEQPQQLESYQLADLSNRHQQSSERSDGESIAASSLATEYDDAPIQTAAQLRTERIRFAVLTFSFFLVGWNDGSLGPLLPAIKQHYKVPFVSVSSLFIFTSLGAACGSFSIFFLLEKFGFGKVVAFGAALQTAAYAVQSIAPPFPVFVFCSFLNGVGMSFQDTTGNGFVASLKRDGAHKMGLLHAFYGLGAFVAPLVATQFLPMKHWSFFYFTSTGLALSVASALASVFRFKRQAALFEETNTDYYREEPGATEPTSGSIMKHVLALPIVHYLAFYVCVYVGIEVTLGGWIVTFIVDERGGGASAGYISSGFFGGLMAGRLFLLPINDWLGERRVIFVYALLTLGLDVVIWRVRSLIGNAVAVSMIGVLFGPMYPVVMHQAGLVLPPRILAGAVGYIAGFGIIGGAVVPFVTGSLATKFEINVMPVVVLVMTSLMALTWALAVTHHKPRTD
ncbi:MFS general substrate transporter [Auricularia subglabra TFB-10046 SS5]|nr:MFS general substrate transporter [Auricularia subglabra TFB-10046 SS5]